MFTVKIRSRHNTHGAIRRKLFSTFRTVVRFGSSTPTNQVFPNGKLKPGSRIIEINTVDAVKVSANKRLMKEAFDKLAVKTATWLFGNTEQDVLAKIKQAGEKFGYPIVAKHIYGSRGTGNYLLKTEQELVNWLKGKELSKYIFEKYYDFVREYRLHTSSQGCFYTCRKMLKGDTPQDKRWFRNDSNSVWVKEENPAFDKPVNWDAIVAECVKALKATGLDVAAFDVKVQSAKNKDGHPRKEVDFIIIESNSAPSFGDITVEKYMENLPKIIKAKENA